MYTDLQATFALYSFDCINSAAACLKVGLARGHNPNLVPIWLKAAAYCASVRMYTPHTHFSPAPRTLKP